MARMRSLTEQKGCLAEEPKENGAAASCRCDLGSELETDLYYLTFHT